MAAFDDLVAAVAEADSEFRLSQIPVRVIREGVLDCAARLKALEAKVSGEWQSEADRKGDGQ